MFPINEHTLLLLAALAVSALVGGFISMKGMPHKGITTLVLVSGGLWPFLLAAAVHLDHYTLTAAMMVSGLTLGALVAGALWGLVVRRLGATPPPLVWMVVPVLVLAGGALEYQRVPNAACAQAAPFVIGDLSLRVPRAMSTLSKTGEGYPVQDWQGSYSAHPINKPDVRALCRATQNGTTPVQVSHLWISASDYRRFLEEACALKGGEVCDALAQTRPAVLQLYSLEMDTVPLSMGQFPGHTVQEARGKGTLEGVSCSPSTDARGRTWCHAWYQVTPEVYAVTTAWTQEGTQEQVLDNLKVLTQSFLSSYALEAR
jgi:hypothetical protein